VIGTCNGCGKLKKLDQASHIVGHYYAITVSRSAVRSVGAGKVRRTCPGSGKPPGRVER
jgi:hypothetical protein